MGVPRTRLRRSKDGTGGGGRFPEEHLEVFGARREDPQGSAAGGPAGNRKDLVGQGGGRRGRDGRDAEDAEDSLKFPEMYINVVADFWCVERKEGNKTLSELVSKLVTAWRV